MKKKILYYYLLISTSALFASQADLDMLFENLTALQTKSQQPRKSSSKKMLTGFDPASARANLRKTRRPQSNTTKPPVAATRIKKAGGKKDTPLPDQVRPLTPLPKEKLYLKEPEEEPELIQVRPDILSAPLPEPVRTEELSLEEKAFLAESPQVLEISDRSPVTDPKALKYIQSATTDVPVALISLKAAPALFDPKVSTDGASIILTDDGIYSVIFAGQNIRIEKNGSQLTFSLATGAETPKIAAEGTDATTSPTTVTKPVPQKNLLAGIRNLGGVKGLRKAKPTAQPTAKDSKKPTSIADKIAARRKAMSGDPEEDDDRSSDDDDDDE